MPVSSARRTARCSAERDRLLDAADHYRRRLSPDPPQQKQQRSFLRGHAGDQVITTSGLIGKTAIDAGVVL